MLIRAALPAIEFPSLSRSATMARERPTVQEEPEGDEGFRDHLVKARWLVALELELAETRRRLAEDNLKLTEAQLALAERELEEVKAENERLRREIEGLRRG
jgi:hypothetical protein